MQRPVTYGSFCYRSPWGGVSRNRVFQDPRLLCGAGVSATCPTQIEEEWKEDGENGF